MNKFIACLVAVAAIAFTAQESQAQCYGGGRGISIGFSNFGGGYGGGFGSSYYGGRSFGGVGVGFNSFGGGGFYGGSRYVARPVYAPVYRAPVYRSYGGGGFYRGGRCGY